MIMSLFLLLVNGEQNGHVRPSGASCDLHEWVRCAMNLKPEERANIKFRVRLGNRDPLKRASGSSDGPRLKPNVTSAHLI